MILYINQCQYLDSMTTLEIPAAGYSICYELGIFKQKIVEGQQVELPDDWMQLGDAWLLPKLQEAEEVRFGGKVRTRWDNNHLMVVHEDGNGLLADISKALTEKNIDIMSMNTRTNRQGLATLHEKNLQKN